MSLKVKDSPGYELSKNVKKLGGNPFSLTARGRQSHASQLKIVILTVFILTLNNFVIQKVTSKCHRREEIVQVMSFPKMSRN